VQKRSGYPYEIKEFTTVTKKIRRVALFDVNLVKRANMFNKPTSIALNGVDYLNYDDKGKTDFSTLTSEAKAFIIWIEGQLGVKVDFVGTGPTNEEIIDRRQRLQKEVEIFGREIAKMS